jgi:hypothetical protein
VTPSPAIPIASRSAMRHTRQRSASRRASSSTSTRGHRSGNRSQKLRISLSLRLLFIINIHLWSIRDVFS